LARRKLLIFGAGGFGREVAAWAGRASWRGEGFELVAFIDDNPPAPRCSGVSVLSLAQAAALHPGAGVLVSVGNPQLRERLVAKALEAGLSPTPPLLHPSVEYDRDNVVFEEGVVVCAGSILTVDIRVHAHAQINLDCTVGHDAVIGPYATLSPGVHISGNVTLERRTFIGTGAVTVNGLPGRPLVIGADAVVGAGAVVTRDVPQGVTVTGVPARPREG